MDILGWESRQRLAKLDLILERFKKNIVPDLLIFDSNVAIDETNPALVILSNGKNEIRLNRRRYLGLRQFDGDRTTYEILRSGFGLLGLSSVFVQRMYKIGFLKDVEELLT